MNVGLMKNHNVKFYKKDKKILKDIDEIKYLLVNISTPLKGRLYTLAKSKDVHDIKDDDICEIDMDISYANVDVPCCDSTVLKSRIPIKSINNKFCIYPLLNEMYHFNYVKNEFIYIDNCINIDFIRFKLKNINIEIDNEDVDDVEINKIFKKHNMRTYLADVTGTNHIIIDNGKWYFSKKIPKVFDYILYNLHSESTYLLTYDEYIRLYTIEDLIIKIWDKTIYSEYEYIQNDINEIDCTNYIESKGVGNILEYVFLYFPQLIEMEKTIYKSKLSLEIIIETKYKNYRLSIAEKEVSEGLCLFDIILKLLKM